MKNKKILYQYLISQRLMTLAVFEKKPWVCTLYYYMDKDFNFYVLTSPKTKHGQMLEKNKKVACTVFDSRQKVTDKKVGVQIEGVISMVKSIKQLKYALKMWNKLNPGIAHIINYKNIKEKVISGRIYKIKPRSIKFFSEELYGEEEAEVFKF